MPLNGLQFETWEIKLFFAFQNFAKLSPLELFCIYPRERIYRHESIYE